MTYISEVLADSPVAYWTLDTFTSGKFASSVGTHDLTVINASAPSVVTGKVGNCLSLAGVDQTGLTHGASSGNILGSVNTITIEGWWKSSQVGLQKVLCAADNEGTFDQRNWALRVDGSGNCNGLVFSGGTVATPTASLNVCDNNWHHLVMVYNGSTVKLYVDTVERASVAFTGNVNASTSSTVFIGYYALGGVPTALIDEVAVYNTALSPTRITAHYNAASVTVTDARAAQVALRALVTSPGDARAAQVAARVLVQTTVASRLAAQQVEVVTKGVPTERLAAQQLEVVLKVSPAERLAAQQLEVIVPVYTSTEPANTAYTTAVKADSPLGYYRLEDTDASTRVYDSSGNARHGTRTGGTDTLSLVDGGRAVQFALQAGQGIDCGASNVMGTGLANMSVEAWVRTTSSSGQKVILAARDNSGAGGSNNYAIYTNNNKLQVAFYCASGFLEPITTLAYNDGLWHHVVGVYNGATVKIYVDGAEVSSTALVGGNVNSGGSARLKIGSTGGSTVAAGTAFEGTIDEVAIYGTALSSTRVSAHYAARLATVTYAQTSRESLRVATKSPGAAVVTRASLRVAVTHRTSARLYAEHVRVLGTAPLARSSGRLYAEHVRVAHSTAALEIPVGVTAKTWSGSAWADSPIKVWNGSTWADAIAAKTWNGSAWV